MLHTPPKIWTELSRAKLAIASFGVTAYELAALGVPAMYLCLTDTHRESLQAFEKERIAVSLGVPDETTWTRLATEAPALLNNRKELQKMSAAARGIMDGHGADRIVRTIVNHVEEDAP